MVSAMRLPQNGKQFLTLGGSEVAHLVEDVVGGQQHLRLDERDLAVHEQGGGVHHGLAGVGMSGRDQAADHGDPWRFGGNALRRFRDCARRTRVARPDRAADSRKPTVPETRIKSGTGRLGAPREINDLGGVAGEISDGGIDLAQRNLHTSSVKLRTFCGQVRSMRGRDEESLTTGDPGDDATPA